MPSYTSGTSGDEVRVAYLRITLIPLVPKEERTSMKYSPLESPAVSRCDRPDTGTVPLRTAQPLASNKDQKPLSDSGPNSMFRSSVNGSGKARRSARSFCSE